MLVFIVPLFSSCSVLNSEGNGESSYTAKILWESNAFVLGSNSNISIEGSSIYVFERTEHRADDDYMLVKLNANTGSVIWQTEPFPMIQLITPKALGNYVYVFIYPSLIYSYNIETGELSTIIQTDTENSGIEIEWNAIAYENYLYFGIYGTENYLARLDTTTIERTRNPADVQHITPEVIWRPALGNYVLAEPVIKDNIIYCLSYCGITSDDPIELVGINMDTKVVVFHKWIDYDKGMERNSLFIHEDIIYVLGESLSAFNLNTGEQIFKKTFSGINPLTAPDNEWYAAIFSSRGKIYHKGKIYYTNSYAHVICIDAQTGKLVWKDAVPPAGSLGINPVIVNDKMYIPYYSGLRVYNTNTGKLIGVDTSLLSSGSGRSLLYNDYMITVRRDRNTGSGTLVAVDVGE